MGAYKQFSSNDVIKTPFIANKTFSFEGLAAITGSGVDLFLGNETAQTDFILNNEPTTGYNSTIYQKLLYNSVKQLYYSNFISGSYGSPISTSSVILAHRSKYNEHFGKIDGPRFDNFYQSSILYPRTFPTASNDTIGIISIPSTLFGEYIMPKSFSYICSGGTYGDDGDGNLISGSTIVGNIFYGHGTAILTSGSSQTKNLFVTASVATCSFQSTFTINENQFRCIIKQNEFNMSLNPSLVSGSGNVTSSLHRIYDFATGSLFEPYITMVGLYNNDHELMAVAKLAQPLTSSPTTDTTIIINIDM